MPMAERERGRQKESQEEDSLYVKKSSEVMDIIKTIRVGHHHFHCRSFESRICTQQNSIPTLFDSGQSLRERYSSRKVKIIERTVN